MDDDVIYKMTPKEEHVSIFIGVIFILMSCFGVPINVLAIKLLMQQHSSITKLIDKIQISMCVSNLIQVFPLYTLYAIASIKKEWMFGMTACKMLGFWVHFNANAAIWHLVAFAWEQKRALSAGNQPSHAVNKFKQYGTLLFVWTHGFFWSFVPLVGWARYRFEGLGLSCSVSWEETDASSLTYTLGILIFNFIIPVGVITYCYVKIFKGFKSHVIRVSTSVGARNQEKNQINLRKLATIGSVMTGFFLFAWTPYAMVAVITIVNQKPVSPIAATLPAVFGKCSVIIYPTIILLKRSAYKFRLPFSSEQVDHAPTAHAATRGPITGNE